MLTRLPTIIEFFPLGEINAMRRVATTSAVACRVSITAQAGLVPTDAVVAVRRVEGRIGKPFATPLSLTAGAPSILIDADAMRGVETLELEVTTAEASASYARLEVIQDQDL
jgi:hypothetical protein